MRSVVGIFTYARDPSRVSLLLLVLLAGCAEPPPGPEPWAADDPDDVLSGREKDPRDGGRMDAEVRIQGDDSGQFDKDHNDAMTTSTCDANCQDVCVWVIEYETDSHIEITDNTTAEGPYPQSTPGTLIMQFTNDGGTPGDGPAAILHSVSPTGMIVDTILGDIVTSVTVTAGSSGNRCPLATGTVLGTKVTWDACAYQTDDWGTVDFDPSDQQVPDASDAGCLRVHSVGNIECGLGFGCSSAGLSEGANPQDDTWDQPLGETTVDFSGFAGGNDSSVEFGGSNHSGSPFYPDDRDSPTPTEASSYTESPTNTGSRLWRSAWTVKEIDRECVPPPTGCE